MMLRRVLTITAAAVASLALAAGPASAHFCYKKNVNPNAWLGQYGSSGWLRLGDLAVADFGLCDAGVEVLTAGVGGTPDTLIKANGVMAGPTDGNKAIGHLDFSNFESALEDAFAACSTAS
jgi:hypothetical protein